MSQIQYGDRQTGSTSISGSTLDASEIPKVIHPCSHGQSVQWHAPRCRTCFRYM